MTEKKVIKWACCGVSNGAQVIIQETIAESESAAKIKLLQFKKWSLREYNDATMRGRIICRKI